MATSIRNLLATVDAETWGTAPAGATDAITALRHVARALNRLAHDGLDPAVGGHRERSTLGLAAACISATQTLPADGTGRITALVGAAADIAGQLRSDGNRHDRWAVAAAFADTARHLVDRVINYDPYRNDPALIIIGNHARTIAKLAAVDAPPPHRRSLLDYARAIPELQYGMTSSEVAAESVIALTGELRAANRDPGSLSIHDIDGCLRVAEQLSRYAALATTIAEHITVRHQSPDNRAADAWRTARHQLSPFDDGTRRKLQPSTLLRWATHAYSAARATCGPINELTPERMSALPDLDQVTTSLRIITNQLPEIADRLRIEIQHSAKTKRMRAPTSAVTVRLDRLQQRAPIADVADLAPALKSLQTAAIESAALAVTLDHSVPHLGRHPQPDLVTSLSARIPIEH